MRLFLIEWCGKEHGMIEVVKELKNHSHEIVYWSGYGFDFELDKKEFPDTIFHEYEDARAGISSPQVDDSSFEPPAESLIKKLYEIESNILVMMNKHFEWMSENQKKHLYYRYIQYWDGVFKKYKPEAIIWPSAPHTIYDLVIYGLARLYNVKTIMFEQSSVNDRASIVNDYMIGCELLEKQLKEDEDITFSVSDFEPDVRDYYNERMNFSKPAAPLYVKEAIVKYSFMNIMKTKSTVLFRSLRDRVFLERIGNHLFRLGKGNLKKEYEKLQAQVDFNKKYIYMPLHYQPECSTCPLGGIFVDQILAIKMLSYCLPKDWLIYIKEHPYQWKPRGLIYFAYRYKGYYETIAKLRNVCLVPINTDTFRLIEKSQAVASIGGTAVWEGLFYGKPGIIFGYAWYKHCQGIFKVQDIFSCQNAMNKIMAGYKVDHQSLINYLGSFQKIALNVFQVDYYKKISPITVEQNIKNIVNMLSKELA